jgi:hypothetical protein
MPLEIVRHVHGSEATFIEQLKVTLLAQGGTFRGDASRGFVHQVARNGSIDWEYRIGGGNIIAKILTKSPSMPDPVAEQNIRELLDRL